ncbi:MAG: M48 family metallopeptidase [Pirellulaceae bacterium]
MNLKKWGTMQSVLSSRSRMSRVVSNIVFDFSCKPRISSQRGNAILVAKSIYEACKYIVLHELHHLIEPTHNARFQSLMKQHMLNWELRRDALSRLPVRHEHWGY